MILDFFKIPVSNPFGLLKYWKVFISILFLIISLCVFIYIIFLKNDLLKKENEIIKSKNDIVNYQNDLIQCKEIIEKTNKDIETRRALFNEEVRKFNDEFDTLTKNDYNKIKKNINLKPQSSFLPQTDSKSNINTLTTNTSNTNNTNTNTNLSTTNNTTNTNNTLNTNTPDINLSQDKNLDAIKAFKILFVSDKNKDPNE